MTDKKPGKPKGSKKTGGRTKGTPNKTTGQTKEFIADILQRNESKFNKALKALEGEVFVRAYTQLLPYVSPKMQSVSVEAQINAEIKALNELLDTAPEEAIAKIAEKMLELQSKQEESKTE